MSTPPPATPSSAATVKEQLRRAADLVRAAMPSVVPAWSPEREDVTTVQVERGTLFPMAMLGSPAADVSARTARLIESSTAVGPAALRVVDRAGHARPVYRGLLVYSWLQAYRLLYETLPRDEFGRWDEALRAWCDALEAELTATAWPEGPMPAAHGELAAAAAWAALALHAAGRLFVRDAWTDLAADTFGRAARKQSAGGALLMAAASDNPEPVWFHELVLLHAMASYAVQAEERGVAAAVKRATDYHLRETQPDHATNHPWALFAFLWNPATRSLADSLLHSTRVNDPAGVDGLSLMLLADALYCLRLFE